MSVRPESHIRVEAQAVPRRGFVLVFAIVLLIAWGVVDPTTWWLGLLALGLAVVGVLQMLGRIPSL